MRKVVPAHGRGHARASAHPAPTRRIRRAGLLAAGAFALALAIDVLAFGPVASSGSRAGLGSDATPGVTAPDQTPSGLGADYSPEDAAGGNGGNSGSVGEAATGPAVDSLLTLLAATEPVDGSSQASTLLATEVPDAALALLDAYHTGPTCMLAHEGYLDLSGNAWGCVVQGEGWVDVAVVQTHAEGESQVSVTRMLVDEWVRDLEDVMSDEG